MATSNADLNWIANYIWGIADDVLRDLYVRGKYRDVILPMTVLRRLDAVLEDSKQDVLDADREAHLARRQPEPRSREERRRLRPASRPRQPRHGLDLRGAGPPLQRGEQPNPPYGKSWKTDLERMGGKKEMRDPRFVIEHAGDADYSLVTRSSDGQMLFLANKLSKMKQDTPLGSRIAEVHNGSSLFTGDARQGESNIRRWIIENDWLEAIVALPLNMFYNTGIATYVWVLTNRKPAHRRGKVQLIDATKWHRPLRKNLGKKNCELGEDDIARICETFLAFEETGQSRIFDNAAFGYWKVPVERPLRIEGADPNRVYKAAEIRELKETGKRSEEAPPVIRKIHKRGTAAAPLRGLFAATVGGRAAVVGVAAALAASPPQRCRGGSGGHYLGQGLREYADDIPSIPASGQSNSSTLRAFPVPLPAPEEQAEMLDVLSEKTNALVNAAVRTEREIDLMREYRTRLIADVVTGKVDVREAAAGLPEVDSVAAGDAVNEFGDAGARSESSDINELQADVEEMGA